MARATPMVCKRDQAVASKPSQGAAARRVRWAAAAFACLVSVAALTAPFPARAQAASDVRQHFLDTLRREVTDRLQASGRFSAFTVVDAATVRARTLAGADHVIRIDTLATSVQARPRERGALVEQFLRTAVASVSLPADPPQGREAFLEQLRLIVRHKGYVGRTAAAPGATPPIWRPLAGDAVVIVAFHDNESIRLAPGGAGAPHGLSDDALFAEAKARAAQQASDMRIESAGPLRALMAADEAYSPSLMMVEDVWTKLAANLGPDLVVAVPDRTVLMAAAARHMPELRQAVDALVRQRKVTPHIPHLIQRTAGGWRAIPIR